MFLSFCPIKEEIIVKGNIQRIGISSILEEIVKYYILYL